MGLSKDEIQELARILEARDIKGGRRVERPKLRLITPPTPKLLDPIFREAHLKRIHHLQKAYRLEWLVDQETFDVASVSCLEDCDLIRLLILMEKARECIIDGVSFEDAGLARSTLRKGNEVHSRALDRFADSTNTACDRFLQAVARSRSNTPEEAPF